MASVLCVANYILRKIGPTTTMKLQKLVYYCQAWSLAWDDKPLFDEDLKPGQTVQCVLSFLSIIRASLH